MLRTRLWPTLPRIMDLVEHMFLRAAPVEGTGASVRTTTWAGRVLPEPDWARSAEWSRRRGARRADEQLHRTLSVKECTEQSSHSKSPP